MSITIKTVESKEKHILSEILDHYLDDLSKYVNEKFPRPYKFLDLYFSESNRKPFFIVADGKYAGAALVNLKDPLSQDKKQAISEFYILPEFRNQGVGSQAAIKIFDMYPGTWVIREIQGNPASNFWKEVIEKYTNGNYIEYEQNDEIRKRKVQEFVNLKKN